LSERSSTEGGEAVIGFDERLSALEGKVEILAATTSQTALLEQLSLLTAELKKAIEDAKKVVPPAPTLQFSGQVFSLFSYTASGVEGNNFSRFDFDRVYLTAKGQLFAGVKYQLTSDIFRNAASGSYYAGLAMRVKFAMIDYAPVPTVSIKAGMIPTSWCGTVDGYWKYRGIAQSVTDRQGYFSTADMGVSATYTTPDKSLELSGFVLNGNGYTAPENNRFKDYSVRFVASPFVSGSAFKSFSVAGYGYKGANATASGRALQRDRFGGLVSYGYAGATANVEYNVRTEAQTHPDTTQSGYALSMFGEIKSPFESLMTGFAFVWRFDVVDQDDSRGGDMNRFMILGLAYKPNDKVSLVVDHQLVRSETSSLKRTDGTKIDRDGRTFVHLILTF
jgi:hypothetical protein